MFISLLLVIGQEAVLERGGIIIEADWAMIGSYGVVWHTGVII